LAAERNSAVQRLKADARRRAVPIGRWLSRLGITPNSLTVAGCLLNFGVGAVLTLGYNQIGGVLVLVVGAFDMLDGALARAAGKSTRFGAFLDSTLDRYSEAAVFLGILASAAARADLTVVLLTYAAAVGSLMVSYARARAECLGISCDVGWLQRPERVILLGLGLILGLTLPVLAILAVLTNVTAIQRILHVRATTHD
jgi:CDP-diacylglycerol--glycerol-3-phosphate 3-phosphatidyltransferase